MRINIPRCRQNPNLQEKFEIELRPSRLGITKLEVSIKDPITAICGYSDLGEMFVINFPEFTTLFSRSPKKDTYAYLRPDPNSPPSGITNGDYRKLVYVIDDFSRELLQQVSEDNKSYLVRMFERLGVGVDLDEKSFQPDSSFII